MQEFLGNLRSVFEQSGLNFGTIFGQSWLNFQDYCQTIQAEILGLFLGSFGLSLGFVLILRLMSVSFVVCLAIPIIR